MEPPDGETWQAWQIADYLRKPRANIMWDRRVRAPSGPSAACQSTLRSVVELGQLEGHSMKQIAPIWEFCPGDQVPAGASPKWLCASRDKAPFNKLQGRLCGIGFVCGVLTGVKGVFRKGDVMDGRDKVANELVVELQASPRPAQATKNSQTSLSVGCLLMALGGLAM